MARGATTARNHPARHKSSLYARAGLVDYWILDLAHRRLEIYRDPARDASAPFGWRYASVEHMAPDATVAPLAASHARVRVSDLLP